MYWYGEDPGDWPINVYFERLDRIADLMEIDDPKRIDPLNGDYQCARLDRMQRRKLREV